MTEERFLELAKNLLLMDEETWNDSLKEGEAQEFPNMLEKYINCMEDLNHALDMSGGNSEKASILKQQVLDQYDIKLENIQIIMKVLAEEEKQQKKHKLS